MRNPQGHIAFYGPNDTLERDTFTCAHCNGIVIVKPAAPVTESGGWCLQCYAPICPACTDKGCTPFERKLEAMERRDVFLRSLG